jgi:Na+/proline symporter
MSFLPDVTSNVIFVTVPFVSVILLGLILKRANYAGALFGCGGGVLIASAVMGVYVAARANGSHIHWLYAAFFAQVIIVIGIVLVTLMTPAPEPSRWQPFVWRREFLNELRDESRPWYKSIRLWFTVYAVAWIAIYAYMW